jgi:hypothetical protein
MAAFGGGAFGGGIAAFGGGATYGAGARAFGGGGTPASAWRIERATLAGIGTLWPWEYMHWK